MPRRARVSLPEVLLHILQRGSGRKGWFYAGEDYGFYLDCLQEYVIKTPCQVHAYVLMTDHLHLLATALDVQGAGVLRKASGPALCAVRQPVLSAQRDAMGRTFLFVSDRRRELPACMHALHRTQPGPRTEQ